MNRPQPAGRRPKPQGYADPVPAEPRTPDETDDLIALQSRVLDALEDAGHPCHAEADGDPALKDSATTSQRKAWLAIYGPLTSIEL